jgi:hypothetical protein
MAAMWLQAVTIRRPAPPDARAGDVAAGDAKPQAPCAGVRRLDDLELANRALDGGRRLDVHAFDLAADSLTGPTTLRCGRH